MPAFPEGTVSFLFTDVEGSTAALKQLRERYAGVLLEQEAVLRAAFAAHDGLVVDTQGDAFFVCFRRAHDAVAAAAEAQRGLAERSWPEDVSLRVRMGIHTGEPEMRDGRYFGIDVHRAARIAAAAHGGQVLLSDAARDLVVHDLPSGVGLRDLGVQHLKGLDHPERVHQLLVPGLAHVFPPLQTADLEERRRRRRRLRGLLVSALAGVAAAAVAVPVFVYGQGSGGGGIAKLEGNTVGVLDAATGGIAHAAALRGPPGSAAGGEHAAWVVAPEEGTASRVDPRSGAVVQTVGVGADASAVAVGGGAAWVARTSPGTVSRIDLGTNEVVQTIPVGNAPAALAYDRGTLWVASGSERSLARLDPDGGQVVRTIALPAPGRGVAVGFGSVWVSHGTSGTVSRIDPKSNRLVATVHVGNGADAIAAGPDSVWVANELDGTLSRLDPRTTAVRATIPVGRGPSGVAPAGEKIWVTSAVAGTLVRIDPARGVVDRTVRLGGSPQGVASVDGALIVPVRPLAGHRGGTLRVATATGWLTQTLDPAFIGQVSGAWIVSVVGDGLVSYKRVGGPDGATLAPDLALAVPSPTDRGTTYSFRLRPGIRYSNGRPVRASDVRSSLERLFRVRSPYAHFYAGILGGQACLRTPRSCTLARGIAADDRGGTVTFRLAAPDADFLDKLALLYATVLPAGTSDRPAVGYPAPATGPYRATAFRPGNRVTLARNPRFRPRPTAKPDGYPDRIVITAAPATPADERRQIAAVNQGRIDVMEVGLILRSLPQLRIRYPSRLHGSTMAWTNFLLLNKNLPPFDNVDARRAVSYAVDRGVSRPLGEQPTCQALPPGLAGYRAYCPYTLNPETGSWSAPDLAAARRLVARSGTRGTRVTIATPARTGRASMESVANDLRRIGYRVALRAIPDTSYFTVMQSPKAARTIQAALVPWVADYPTPAGFLTGLFHCGTPFATFTCSPALDRAIDRAAAERITGARSSSGLWTAADRLIVDEALVVPLTNPTATALSSSRLGNLQTHALYGPLYDQAWVR